MTDIVAFLTACLDEDEAAARATRQASAVWRDFSMDGELRESENGGTIAFVPYREDRAHIARHDPARVLRDVMAKRRILARHVNEVTGNHPCKTWSDLDELLEDRNEDRPCPDLRALAAPYADRNGFNPAWRVY